MREKSSFRSLSLGCASSPTTLVYLNVWVVGVILNISTKGEKVFSFNEKCIYKYFIILLILLTL